MLRVIDEFPRTYLAIEVVRRLRSDDVVHVLARLFTRRGVLDPIRPDNGWLAGGATSTVGLTE